MELSQEESSGIANTLDSIFGGHDWRSLLQHDRDGRVEGCIELFRTIAGAKWATPIRMLGKNHETRYFLLHLTNHDAGRELMKECIWKVCPEGGFCARISDDPNQQFMITPEPDLSPLREWIVDKLKEEPARWQDLIEKIRQELWRTSHLNQVVRDLRKEGIIEGRDYRSRFAPKNNPELYLSGRQ